MSEPTRNPADYYVRSVTAAHETKALPPMTVYHNVDVFNLFNDRLLIELPDWVPEAFVNYGEKLGLFTKTYQLSGEEFVSFYAANQSLVDGIKEQSRILCGAPSDADFRYFQLSVTGRILKIKFYKAGESFSKTYDGDTYNNLIIQKVTEALTADPPQTPIVESASNKAFEIAEQKEPDYWAGMQTVS